MHFGDMSISLRKLLLCRYEILFINTFLHKATFSRFSFIFFSGTKVQTFNFFLYTVYIFFSTGCRTGYNDLIYVILIYHNLVTEYDMEMCYINLSYFSLVGN